MFAAITVGVMAYFSRTLTKDFRRQESISRRGAVIITLGHTLSERDTDTDYTLSSL